MAGHGDYPAVIYDSPVTGVKRTYSYSDLLAEVETFAGVLREEGVGKGDVILIYSEFFSFFFLKKKIFVPFFTFFRAFVSSWDSRIVRTSLLFCFESFDWLRAV